MTFKTDFLILLTNLVILAQFAKMAPMSSSISSKMLILLNLMSLMKVVTKSHLWFATKEKKEQKSGTRMAMKRTTWD
jgi:hypothetical protein